MKPATFFTVLIVLLCPHSGKAAQTAKSRAMVPVFIEPNTESAAIGFAEADKSYEVLSRKGDWVQIRYFAATAWIQGSEIELLDHNGPKGVSGTAEGRIGEGTRMRVAQKFVPLRYQPQPGSKALTYVTPNDEVVVLGTSGGYYRVQFKAAIGYLPQSSFDPAGTAEETSAPGRIVTQGNEERATQPGEPAGHSYTVWGDTQEFEIPRHAEGSPRPRQEFISPAFTLPENTARPDTPIPVRIPRIEENARDSIYPAGDNDVDFFARIRKAGAADVITRYRWEIGIVSCIVASIGGLVIVAGKKAARRRRRRRSFDKTVQAVTDSKQTQAETGSVPLSKERYSLRGEIGPETLLEIFQFLWESRKTGCLMVEDTSPYGIVYFDEGEIVHSSTRKLMGKEALAQILSLEHGRFRFLSSARHPRRTMQLSPMEVIMQWSQAKDEARAAVITS